MENIKKMSYAFFFTGGIFAILFILTILGFSGVLRSSEDEGHIVLLHIRRYVYAMTAIISLGIGIALRGILSDVKEEINDLLYRIIELEKKVENNKK